MDLPQPQPSFPPSQICTIKSRFGRQKARRRTRLAPFARPPPPTRDPAHWQLATALAPFKCYTQSVPTNITLKVSDETARWARLRAAEENTSISRLVSGMLEREMHRTDAYWKAYEQWKELKPLRSSPEKLAAAARTPREELHERGR